MANETPGRDADEAQTRAARAALDDLRQHNGSLGASALAEAARQAADHFAGKDAVGEGPDGATDPYELWGRRIGRSLSLIGLIVLAVYLYETYLR
jgi:hypothetical protein